MNEQQGPDDSRDDFYVDWMYNRCLENGHRLHPAFACWRNTSELQHSAPRQYEPIRGAEKHHYCIERVHYCWYMKMKPLPIQGEHLFLQFQSYLPPPDEDNRSQATLVTAELRLEAVPARECLDWVHGSGDLLE